MDMFEGNRVIAHTRSRYPIFQSPMTWIARSPLVSAFSAAGGMSLLESSARDLSMTTRDLAGIVAAGGVVDGRGMAAAFALGAEGVTMGTRFVASVESPVHPNYKNAIVEAPITGTIMTDNPPRARARGLRTPYAIGVSDGTRERHKGMATLDMLYVKGDVENTSGSAGESAGLIHEIKTARQIIDDTVAGFWREI